MSDELDLGPTDVGDGRLMKMEVDYTSQVDEILEKAEHLTKVCFFMSNLHCKIQECRLESALELLFGLEKQTRLGADMKSNGRLVQAMARLCFEAGNWTLLNETIISLSKKRSLIKQAIARMVRDCVTFVDQTPNEDIQMKLIDTLRTITDGKIYVEVERARLTYRLVKKLESEHKIEEACAMLLELQVETYGSMEMKEKVEYLLEQMRLCIAKSEFDRPAIISRKISTKFFADTNPEVQQLKLNYYRMMIEIGQHESNYLDICRHFRAILDTPFIVDDPTRLEDTLKNVILYVLLAPHDNEQWDLLHRIKQSRQLEKVADYKKLLDVFTTEELTSWRGVIVSVFEKLLKNGTHSSTATGVFGTDPQSLQRWTDFHKRVVEHNIRIIAKYYSRISFDRMADLIDLSVDKMEEFLCNLIVTDVVTAKVDRPSGMIDFRRRKAVVEHLDEWVSSVHKVTDLLNKVSHQIAKEQMVHRHLHTVR